MYAAVPNLDSTEKYVNGQEPKGVLHVLACVHSYRKAVYCCSACCSSVLSIVSGVLTEGKDANVRNMRNVREVHGGLIENVAVGTRAGWKTRSVMSIL